MKKVELIIQILKDFDECMLKHSLLQYGRIEKHPWMRFKKADIEATYKDVKHNYFALGLGCNMAWYPYISKQLKKGVLR